MFCLIFNVMKFLHVDEYNDDAYVDFDVYYHVDVNVNDHANAEDGNAQVDSNTNFDIILMLM